MRTELTPVQERNVRLSMEVVALKKKLGETQLLLTSYQQRLRDDTMLAAAKAERHHLFDVRAAGAEVPPAGARRDRPVADHHVPG
jgi:hypothetical protein